MPAGQLFYFIGVWLLVIGLLARFLERKKPKPSKKAWLTFVAAGMLFMIWGACGGFYAIYWFTDRMRAHRSLNPDAVVAIEVLPGRSWYPSLVPRRLVITDRQRTSQIARALVAAEPWAAAHPRVNWQCILRVNEGAGKLSYVVSSTTNNGVLIEVGSEWLLLGEYRQDGLKQVLEQLVENRMRSKKQTNRG